MAKLGFPVIPTLKVAADEVTSNTETMRFKVKLMKWFDANGWDHVHGEVVIKPSLGK